MVIPIKSSVNYIPTVHCPEAPSSRQGGRPMQQASRYQNHIPKLYSIGLLGIFGGVVMVSWQEILLYPEFCKLPTCEEKNFRPRSLSGPKQGSSAP